MPSTPLTLSVRRLGGEALKPIVRRARHCCQSLRKRPSSRLPHLGTACHFSHPAATSRPTRLPTPPPAANMGNRASREAGAAGGLSPAAATPAGEQAAAAPSECPVPAEFRQQIYRNPAVYNVYNQRINDPTVAAPAPSPLSGLPGQDVLDPTNHMPLEANQQPCPGQRRLLSTDRQPSNIPKGGTEATWVYPSPQMFFNGEWVCCGSGGACGKGADGHRWHRPPGPARETAGWGAGRQASCAGCPLPQPCCSTTPLLHAACYSRPPSRLPHALVRAPLLCLLQRCGARARAMT